ncbi:hypothetical protein P154DRAFT_358200 [Amniculicola lignicola CBS 123094]|uniref:Uncharacterized protein n=1 Tax=Amniculicola lignicola CBS 123094 TaxID=1392246 RepID=A0A6A5WX77_9PLEO|nr:hypothetical protein P154DRAFT_358200 [Amniculicola lignicola CBS 123094]
MDIVNEVAEGEGPNMQGADGEALEEVIDELIDINHEEGGLVGLQLNRHNPWKVVAWLSIVVSVALSSYIACYNYGCIQGSRGQFPPVAAPYVFPLNAKQRTPKGLLDVHNYVNSTVRHATSAVHFFEAHIPDEYGREALLTRLITLHAHQTMLATILLPQAIGDFVRLQNEIEDAMDQALLSLQLLHPSESGQMSEWCAPCTICFQSKLTSASSAVILRRLLSTTNSHIKNYFQRPGHSLDGIARVLREDNALVANLGKDTRYAWQSHALSWQTCLWTAKTPSCVAWGVERWRPTSFRFVGMKDFLDGQDRVEELYPRAFHVVNILSHRVHRAICWIEKTLEDTAEREWNSTEAAYLVSQVGRVVAFIHEDVTMEPGTLDG